MTIQWFPGHMQETEAFLRQSISGVDVLLEILDARLPASSANPILDDLCRNLIRIKILNKNDLADPAITEQWLKHFKDRGEAAMAINGLNASETWKALQNALSDVNKEKTRRIRVMVAGIPNTGKSTLINTLAGKKIAKTGNTPAITRHQQRTGLKNKVDIYDTPGILWPNFENENAAMRLAASGAISDTVINYGDIAPFALNYVESTYPGRITERYGIIRSASQPHSTALLEAIGKKRGCLKKGGIIDYQKVSELFIRELRSGKLGNISLETPEDIMKERADLLKETSVIE